MAEKLEDLCIWTWHVDGKGWQWGFSDVSSTATDSGRHLCYCGSHLGGEPEYFATRKEAYQDGLRWMADEGLQDMDE